MTREYRIAVLGATGAVGTEMVQLLHQRRFPLASLKLLASPQSAGKWLPFGDESLLVEAVSKQTLQSADLVLGATGSDIAKEWAGMIVEQGAVLIDNSSAFRMDPDVPLVIPEVNPEDLHAHRGIVANPNCSTILMALVVWPLHQHQPLKRLIAATYQAASGAGTPAMTELREQTRQILDDEPITKQVFPHPIAFNLFTHNSPIGGNHYCEEEMKMVLETRKIFHQDDLAITATCVRVPVLRAHSEALNIEFHRPFALEEARAILSGAPGLRLIEDWERNYFPMPVDASGEDAVLVGRIRQDISHPNAIEVWLCGDQIRKGAALNAVQIAETLVGARQ